MDFVRAIRFDRRRSNSVELGLNSNARPAKRGATAQMSEDEQFTGGHTSEVQNFL
jgi:hypothetical protein